MLEMSRRDFLKTTAAGATALAFPSLANAAAAMKRKPNIVLIMADDLGYECLGCCGSTSYETPVLDGLASNGIRFDHCYSQPLCTPSRVQIMTGRYNHRNYNGFGKLDPKEITFGNVLKKAGYSTCISGKWQLEGNLEAPHRFGFDEYCLWQIQGRDQRYWNARIIQNGELLKNVDKKYGPDIYCDYLLDFIEKKKDGPFFAYFPMCLTHNPFCPTPDSEGGGRSEKKQGAKYFADMVAYTDKLVGRIDKKLEELSLRENTILIFTGDNGTNTKITSKTKKGKIKGGKSRMTDAGTHVPLVTNWPGTAPKGKVCDDLVDFSDFMVTFAEAAGATVPKDRVIDGRSFLPQLRGEKGAPRDWIFCHYWGARGRQRKGTREFVRDKRWKLYDDGSMYDVPADPLEKSSLAPEKMSGEAKAAKKRFQAVFKSLTKDQR